jgi:hypothetical protein
MGRESGTIQTVAPGVAFWVLLTAATAPGEAPQWSKAELKELFAQAHQNYPNEQAQLDGLARLGGRAYRVEPRAGEQALGFAERVVKLRQLHHPNVKKEQWVLALLRQFYADLAERCGTLARFERDAGDTKFLNQCAAEAKATSIEAEKSLTFVIEGVEGLVEPLPMVDDPSPTKKIGAFAMVQRGIFVIENMERLRFENDRPKADVARTKRGALREIYSAQKQFNVSNQMIGMYDPKMRGQVAHLTAAVSASSPSIYLNELLRGAKEAEMKTLHLLVMSKTNELSELTVLLERPPPPKGKPKKKAPPPPAVIEVRCGDEQSVQLCATKIAEAKAQGLVLYLTD